MTSPSPEITAARAMREAAAKRAEAMFNCKPNPPTRLSEEDQTACDAGNMIAKAIRALPLPEPTPAPRDAEIERLKAELFQSRKFWSDEADKRGGALARARDTLDKIARMDPDGMDRETCACVIDTAYRCVVGIDMGADFATRDRVLSDTRHILDRVRTAMVLTGGLQDAAAAGIAAIDGVVGKGSVHG